MLLLATAVKLLRLGDKQNLTQRVTAFSRQMAICWSEPLPARSAF